MHKSARTWLAILYAFPTVGLAVVTILLYFGLVPVHRPFRRAVSQISADGWKLDSVLVGRDGEIALYRVVPHDRLLGGKRLRGKTQWWTYWGDARLLSIEAPEGERGGARLTVFEKQKQRLTLLHDLGEGKIREVSYWIQGDTWDEFERRTDLNVDGTTDQIISSSRRGAQILLDGEWVLAWKKSGGYVAELAQGEVAVKFEDGKWVLCDE